MDRIHTLCHFIFYILTGIDISGRFIHFWCQVFVFSKFKIQSCNIEYIHKLETWGKKKFGLKPLPYEWCFPIKKKPHWSRRVSSKPVFFSFFFLLVQSPFFTVSAFICLPVTPLDLFLPAFAWFTESLLCTSGMFIEKGCALGLSGQSTCFHFCPNL